MSELEINHYLQVARGSFDNAVKHVQAAEKLFNELPTGELSLRYLQHLKTEIWVMKQKLGLS